MGCGREDRKAGSGARGALWLKPYASLGAKKFRYWWQSVRTIHVSNLEKISRGMTKSTKAAAAVDILQLMHFAWICAVRFITLLRYDADSFLRLLWTASKVPCFNHYARLKASK